MAPLGPIALLTDFGHRDAYVGVLHGVISARAPQVRVIDLCHEVSPQGVAEAGFLLATSVPFFPSGTVYVAVVDPGVGSARQVLCARTAAGCFLAPDNGLLSETLASQELLELVAVTQRELFLPNLSNTFHGRDLFAPVAAHLALGAPLSSLGPSLTDFVRLPAPRLTWLENAAEAVVRYVDRFGNCVSNLPSVGLAGIRSARIGEVEIPGPLHVSYVAVPLNQPLLVAGSSGFVEVSVNAGNAARMLNLQVGATLRVTFEPGGNP